MCGIAGFVNFGHADESSARVLERMAEILRHRGPDDSGFYHDAGAHLGHRRLSIIDLATGHQPMSSEDGALWIVYNGEIFNHTNLRPELERSGHRYKTKSDTETILHAYEEYGPECVKQFRGMFAFAIWDRSRQTLFCARDRLGIKPFYYYWDGRLLAFASEIKALFEHPAISPALEESLLPEYLSFGYTSEERTLFRGVRKLMPGHHLTLRHEDGRAQLAIERYWEVPQVVEREDRDERAWIEELRRRLEETVRMRLMSDVPLGMFLSGGVDSSAIAALMKRMVSGPLMTFSVGYDEAEYSELSFARQASECVGAEHHEVVLGMEDFFNTLPRLIWHEDEPVTWPSSVSLYFVSRLAAAHVKVVLTGEGGDELFGGYGRYRFHLLNSRWIERYRLAPAPLRRRIRAAIANSSLLSAPLRRKLQHTFLGCGEGVESLYLDNFYSACSQAEQLRLFRSPPPASPYRSFLRYWEDGGRLSPLGRMLYADQKAYLVELLMKQDQMSMATSIESRVPLLDHPLVEFAARVPDRLKLRGDAGKYILKKAVEDLLPHDILYRRKMGFPTPLRQWLLEPGAAPLYEVLRGGEGVLAAYLDRGRIEELIGRHQNGAEDATDRLWRLLNLELWGEIFLSGKNPQGTRGLLAPARERAP